MLDIKKDIEECFEHLINDLECLISYPSVLDLETANEQQPFGKANKEVLDAMISIGQRDGFLTKNVDGYAGHIDIGMGKEVIAILGHLDVVPVNETGWDSDPFKLTKKGNRYYGRGTSDDKGPLLYGYYAAKILNKYNLLNGKKIRVIFGCNEESGSNCMKYYFSKEPFPNMGFTPDANFPVVYGEKKGINIEITAKLKDDRLVSLKAGTVANIVPERAEAVLKGNVSQYKESFENFLREQQLNGQLTQIDDQIVFELVGKSSHASLPHLGKNAVVLLCQYLNTVIQSTIIQFVDQYFSNDYYANKLGFGFEGNMGLLTCNLGVLNYINNDLKITLDIRAPHELDINTMKKCLDNATTRFSMQYTFKAGNHLFVDPNSKLIQSLHQAYVECSGDILAKPQAIGGGTYAKTMPNCVAFGPEFPGTDNQIHQNNEFLDIDEAKKAIEIYANALFNLLK